VTYQVLGRRAGPNGREVLSAGGGTKSIELSGPTTTSVPGATDGGSTGGPTAGPTGGTAATTGGTAGTTAGAVSPTGGTVKVIPPKGPANIGKTGIGTPAPNLGGSGTTDFPLAGEGTDPNDPGPGTITYPSDGLASEGGSTAGDGLSSAFYEQGSGRGMAVPVATGFVLAAWAFHLRFLARAARPARVSAPRHRI
jgi:hypothetical protein